MLEWNGIQCWLTTPEQVILPEVITSTGNLSIITCTVKLPSRRSYIIHWTATSPLTAWCEVHTKNSHGKVFKSVAKCEMDSSKPDTQTRSSREGLSLGRNLGFYGKRSTTNHLGMAWLEIRRATSITISDVTKEERIFSIDWLPSDRPDIGTPYVTFVFNFELSPPEEESVSPPPHALPSPTRTLRNSASLGALNQDGDDDGDSKYPLRSMVQGNNGTSRKRAGSGSDSESDDSTPPAPKTRSAAKAAQLQLQAQREMELAISDASEDEKEVARSVSATKKRTRDSRGTGSRGSPRKAKRAKISRDNAKGKKVSTGGPVTGSGNIPEGISGLTNLSVASLPEVMPNTTKNATISSTTAETQQPQIVSATPTAPNALPSYHLFDHESIIKSFSATMSRRSDLAGDSPSAASVVVAATSSKSTTDPVGGTAPSSSSIPAQVPVPMDLSDKEEILGEGDFMARNAEMDNIIEAYVRRLSVLSERQKYMQVKEERVNILVEIQTVERTILGLPPIQTEPSPASPSGSSGSPVPAPANAPGTPVSPTKSTTLESLKLDDSDEDENYAAKRKKIEAELPALRFRLTELVERVKYLEKKNRLKQLQAQIQSIEQRCEEISSNISRVITASTSSARSPSVSAPPSFISSAPPSLVGSLATGTQTQTQPQTHASLGSQAQTDSNAQ